MDELKMLLPRRCYKHPEAWINLFRRSIVDTLYPHDQNGNPLEKTCKGPCGRTLPATSEYWHRGKEGKYGFLAHCKVCRSNKSKLYNYSASTEGTLKRCTGPCGQEYPATAEFFHRSKKCKSGLQARCKECLSDWGKKHHSRPEIKERRALQRKIFYSDPEIRARKNAHDRAYHKQPEVKERARERSRDYRKLPHVQEKRRAEHKAYYSRPEVRERHHLWGRTYWKIYWSRPEARERSRVNHAIRQARKKAISGTYTPTQIQDQLKRQKHKCYYCQKRLKKTKGKYIYHIEHTFPISRVVGTNIPANSIDYLVIACPACNMSKNNKFPWEFPEGGRLL